MSSSLEAASKNLFASLANQAEDLGNNISKTIHQVYDQGKTTLSGHQTPPTDDNNQNRRDSKNSGDTSRDQNQIAGHDADEFGRKRLFFEGEKVYKLYDPNDNRGKQEHVFYELMKKEYPEVLGVVIPEYYGSKEHTDPDASKPGHYLIMQNIFKKLNGEACLADIKIGEPITPLDRKSLPLDFANDFAKKAYIRIATPGLSREGFQLLGIKVKNIKTKEWERFGKSLGRSDHVLGVDYIVEKFLSGADNKHSPYQKEVIRQLVIDLEKIINWLKVQKKFKFRGSSLVLAYLCPDDPKISNKVAKTPAKPRLNSVDMIPLAGSSTFVEHSMPIKDHTGHNIGYNFFPSSPVAIVRLIDFNNWEKSDKIDSHSLKGVENLRGYLLEQL